MKVYNIAIDGPAGAGKSTVAKMAAARLGFVYVDTGSMYRALALYFMRLSIKPGDMSAIGDALAGIDVTLSHRGGFLSRGQTCKETARPRHLQVKSPCQCVHIKQFASKIYPIYQARLHCFGVYLTHINPALCDMPLQGLL